MNSSPRQELVDIVDENDVVVDIVPRALMREHVLRHRAVFVVVASSGAEVLVHRRSRDKDIWPGWLDLAVGGVLMSGETYDEGARREVLEEIGVESPHLEAFDAGKPQVYEDSAVRLLGRCFLLRHDGPFEFYDGEIDEAWWVPIVDLENTVRTEKFLPDSVALVLDRVLALLD